MIRAGSECAVKTTCVLRAAHLRREQLDEAGLVVPALDEVQLGAVSERGVELRAVPGDRHRGVVRREDKTDDLVRASGERGVDRVRDPRRPVLHPRADGHPELALERGARLLGDRVERGRVLDPQPPVPLDKVGEVLRRDRPAAADVGVVRGDVGEPLG